MKGATLLQFSDPEVPERNPAQLTPTACSLEAFGNVAWLPVVDPAIGQGNEPDVFAHTVGRAEALEMTTCPDLATQTLDAPLHD